MAIDPTTLKLIAKVAVSKVKDAFKEENLAKTLLPLLAFPLITVLLLTTFIYMISTPISFLGDMLGFKKKSNESKEWEDLKNDYADVIRLDTAEFFQESRYSHPVISTYKVNDNSILYETKKGMAVTSIGDGGRVHEIGKTSTGYYLLVEYPTIENENISFFAYYGRLDDVFVWENYEVFKGDVIGATSNSLLFEVRAKMSANSVLKPQGYILPTPSPTPTATPTPSPTPTVEPTPTATPRPPVKPRPTHLIQ